MIITSEYTPVANAALVELAQHNLFRIHVGVKYYNLVSGSYVEVNPTAGSIDVTVSKPTLRAPKPVGTLVATDKVTDLVNDGPITALQASKNVNIAGATHYKLVIVTER